MGGLQIIRKNESVPKLRVSVITGRTIDQGADKERGKLSDDYMKSVAVCEMDPDDMKILGVKENSKVQITTSYGSIVVYVKKSRRTPHPKTIFIPYGPWASLIVNSKTHGTGMPSLKGIPAEVKPTDQPVLNLRELLKQQFGRE